MVSKSANYCCTSRTNNTGLMLLCDVALGNMYEARKAEYVEKLPPGFHSTKGLGKTAPDATNVKEIDGATVEINISDSFGVHFSFIISAAGSCRLWGQEPGPADRPPLQRGSWSIKYK